jgi:hypothetical protein
MRVGGLVAILMPILRHRNTDLAQIPAPSENMLGFTLSSYGRSTFRQALENYCNSHHDVGDQAKAIFEACQQLSAKFKGWESRQASSDQDEQSRIVDDEELYDKMLHDEHEQCASWATDRFDGFREDALLSAHICFGIFRDGGETKLSTSRSPDFDSEVRGYFEAWPRMLQDLLAEPKTRYLSQANADFIFQTPKELETFFFDAWVTMLFRGCCWGACHEFVPGERVPPEWWKSQMPIYIG